jgi:hypothetical protein
MQAVLSLINSIPGVAGSLICDGGGRLLSHAFPAQFEVPTLEEAARLLADGAVGLELTPENLTTLDLRFGEDRLVVKPLPGAMLLVLCRRAVNLHFLDISVSVAAGKLSSAPPAVPRPPGPPAGPPPRAASAREPNPRGGGSVPMPTKGLEELRRRLASRNKKS